MTSGLDRVRPRTTAAPQTTGAEIRDADGKRALFSTAAPQSTPAFGSISVECASCGEVSALSARQALKMAVPSLHLPFVRKENPSYVRCPACGKFSWARVHLHL
jgi:hypothetical protein